MTISNESETYSNDCDLETSRCRNLLVSILERAIFDYYGSDNTERRNASAWIYNQKDNESVAWSFDWICTMLNYEPDALRNMITNCSFRGLISTYHGGTIRKLWNRRRVKQSQLSP